MRLFIPTIGTELKLMKKWTFPLFNEFRNETMFEFTGNKYDDRHSRWRNKEKSVEVTLPVGTILVVDRIYIRQGAEDFDSLSFRMPGCRTARRQENKVAHYFHENGKREDKPYVQKTPARPIRFWAKLPDVNNMDVKVVEK